MHSIPSRRASQLAADLERHRVTRRRFVGGASAIAASAVPLSGLLAACGGDDGGGGDDNTVTWKTVGGAYGEAQERFFARPFQEETGTQVRMVEAGVELAPLEQQVRTGSIQWDITELPGAQYFQAAERDLLEPYDTSIVDLSKVPKQFQHEYSAEYGHFLQAITWNQEAISDDEAPTTWAQFFDPDEFPDTKRSVYNHLTSGAILELALIASGVEPTPEALYPIDVERALDTLRPIHDRLLFHETNDQPIQQLQSGAVDLATTFANRVVVARDAGAKMNYTTNQGAIFGGYIVVLKGTPRKDAAMQLVNYIMSNDEAAARFAEATFIGPANQGAFEHIDPSIRDELSTSKANADKVFRTNPRWWVDHLEEIQPRWEEFMATGE